MRHLCDRATNSWELPIHFRLNFPLDVSPFRFRRRRQFISPGLVQLFSEPFSPHRNRITSRQDGSHNLLENIAAIFSIATRIGDEISRPAQIRLAQSPRCQWRRSEESACASHCYVGYCGLAVSFFENLEATVIGGPAGKRRKTNASVLTKARPESRQSRLATQNLVKLLSTP